jgi:hypothetical protein
MDRARSNRSGLQDEIDRRPSPMEVTHGSETVNLGGGAPWLLRHRTDAEVAVTTTMTACPCPVPPTQDQEKTKCGKDSNYGPHCVGEKTEPLSSPGFPPNIPTYTRQNVEDKVQSILGDPNLGLTATGRVIILHLAQRPSGARVEEIAFSTGSKYRWVESQASRLTRLGILRRVAPGTYAINTDREVQE